MPAPLLLLGARACLVAGPLPDPVLCVRCVV